MTTFRRSMDLWGFETIELPLSGGAALLKVFVETPNGQRIQVPSHIANVIAQDRVVSENEV